MSYGYAYGLFQNVSSSLSQDVTNFRKIAPPLTVEELLSQYEKQALAGNAEDEATSQDKIMFWGVRCGEFGSSRSLGLTFLRDFAESWDFEFHWRLFGEYLEIFWRFCGELHGTFAKVGITLALSGGFSGSERSSLSAGRCTILAKRMWLFAWSSVFV